MLLIHLYKLENRYFVLYFSLTLSLLGWLGKLLLALTGTVILGSKSPGTYDHILLSHDSGSPAVGQSGKLLLALTSLLGRI
jgi:hypothetical protein